MVTPVTIAERSDGRVSDISLENDMRYSILYKERKRSLALKRKRFRQIS
jgi:hypothetical protein